MASQFDAIAPAGFGWAVTASDSTYLAMETRSIYIGTGGNIVLEQYNPATGNIASVTYSNVASGSILPVATKKVLATGTTASNIVAMA